MDGYLRMVWRNKTLKQWRMTDATYKCAEGADGGAGSAIGLGTISTLNLK